ncbi:acetyl-CoA carboxylase biotin carboxylase subunit family protein [Streptomyces pathocidini]|uniref:Acetyl-CoA carboxylase biotin carboxylase subunit family protein n=1 Tax=Streptomyces pathocidini TaxID=1650571 RepID=A0ABW7URS1_9ACTN|nr:ATP-grasp domain-containing protein [Streptomyces pathocidini]
MTKIAFLRSTEIQQTAPYLARLADRFARDGIRAKLFYTHGDCDRTDFPGETERLDPDISCDQLVGRLVRWGPDRVISLSVADRHALRDSLAKEALAARGIPVVMHGARATGALANKWETKELMRHHGLATPDGVLLDGDLLNGRALSVPAYHDLVRHHAGRLGYPLLAKPLWDCYAKGITLLHDESELREHLRAPHNCNALLEQCLRGELCSVEIVGRGGAFVLQPLIWKGATGGLPQDLYGQLRYSAPHPVAEARFLPVADRLRALCAGLGLEGSLEVEMIYTEGTYRIIEINPRVSGSTTLSIAASGCNTYDCLVDMAQGTWSADHAAALDQGRRRLAVQFPVRGLTEELTGVLAHHLDLVRASRINANGRVHENAIITCEFTDAPGLADTLTSLQDRYGLTSPDIIQQIHSLLRDTVPPGPPATAEQHLSNRPEREVT